MWQLNSESSSATDIRDGLATAFLATHGLGRVREPFHGVLRSARAQTLPLEDATRSEMDLNMCPSRYGISR